MISADIHAEQGCLELLRHVARGHNNISQYFNTDKDIEHLAQSCQTCLSVKQAPPPAPLHPWTWPSQPWQHVHIDFADPFLNKMYFVAIDAHSKRPEIFEITHTSTSKTIAILHHLFAKYGQIMSDNGP